MSRRLLLLAALAGPASAGDALEDLDEDAAALGAAAVRATVLVRAEGADASVRGSSGVLVHASGYVLSDSDAPLLSAGRRRGALGDRALVRLSDGRTLPAALLRRDERTDSSLWKLEAPPGAELKSIRPGASSAAAPGSLAFLCGNPFGSGEEGRPAVSMGVVCAATPEALYTSAAVNPGSNGGPCLDVQGRLLGIVSTWEADPSSALRGLGRVIPIDRIRAAYQGDPACRKAFPDPPPPSDDFRDAAALDAAFRSAARRASAAVVSVVLEREAGPERTEAWTGKDGKPASSRVYGGPASGVLWSSDGWVLTSLANLWAFDRIRGARVVLPGGRELPARIVARDRVHGLALLKAEGECLPCLERLPSGSLKVGQFAFAAGNPSLPLFTAGILSRLEGRGFVQTDAGLSEANDGGALVDLRGRLIGVAVLRNPVVHGRHSGIGFAVPADRIEEVLPRLKRGKDVLPGILGVTVSEKPGGRVSIASAASEGARKADLRAGDEILSVGGRAVDSISGLHEEVSGRAAGETVEVEVRRGEGTAVLRVELGERP